MEKVAILGCGNLGLALANGLISNPEFILDRLTLSKRNVSTINHLKEKGIQIVSDNAKAIENARLIVVAVKPYDVVNILNDIKQTIDIQNQLIICVATGVTIADIHAVIPNAIVFRAMPNTAADIKQSMTCVCSSTENEQMIQEVLDLFNNLGTSIMIKENLMESATVLAACGIAYVLRFMRSMVQGGIQIGFDSKTASEIVNHVVKGAAELLIENKQHPETEIDKVTTPKGCTIIGLNEMEHNGFSSSLIKGISASYKQIEK
ncbi:MAG: pyrroline-5-carboxylate reductase [Flavobacteriia bacterium]